MPPFLETILSEVFEKFNTDTVLNHFSYYSLGKYVFTTDLYRKGPCVRSLCIMCFPTRTSQEYDDFQTLRESLQAIFPQASRREISKYKRQIADVEESVPVLIITLNQAWIDQHGLPAYNAAMDAFATTKLSAPQRRDNNTRCIFRFQGIHDLITVRDNIRDRGLAPNAFHIGPSFHALVPHAQLEPIGTAWFLEKVGPRRYSFGPDYHFFLL
ncbi:hypothetical protein BC938DRAFT_476661 [Jimgerdemannia flammicorona]|uniref:Uncharacterized protein n=1 Tax=Jimgerdemannia flammicorona TaxID=994334 RepID=A0A433PFC3_9FUNG|nr:hypothetical protein BC938DRAFT_476661 [Jimgerdemannia flammicorona]